MGLTKSEQIRAGLQKSFQSGTSAKASTICYGYKITPAGKLMIDSAEADIVTFIFHCFINGDSLGKISDTLASMDIASPTGRATWSRETISKLLTNEKYTGNVVLGKTQVVEGVQVKSPDNKKILVKEHHLAIISHDLFHAVQQEKRRRSNAKVVIAR